MPYTQINKSTEHFRVKTYTGNGSTNNVAFDETSNMQPDWCWIKSRDASNHNHNLIDAVRAAPKILMSDSTAAEITDSTDALTAFATNGFTLGANTAGTQSYELNKNGDNYVSWNWKAGGATGSSNSDGTITSTVSANTTAGFSIVKFVGNSTSGATVGHGLGAIPKVIIIKNRDTAYSWRSYFAPLGATKYIELDANAAAVTASNFMNDTAPTSTVFSLGNGDTPNKNGDNYIAYCFAEKTGYSKFGSYTGNGNADGTFVYTGFKPAFVIRKRTDATADWRMDDNKRPGYNVIPYTLFPNEPNAETSSTHYKTDFLSNGLKCYGTSGNHNASGGTYIYMAFAEAPLVGSNNVPCTAR